MCMYACLARGRSQDEMSSLAGSVRDPSWNAGNGVRRDISGHGHERNLTLRVHYRRTYGTSGGLSIVGVAQL